MDTVNTILDRKLHALLVLLYDGQLPVAISNQSVIVFAEIVEGSRRKNHRRHVREGLARLGIKVVYAEPVGEV